MTLSIVILLYLSGCAAVLAVSVWPGRASRIIDADDLLDTQQRLDLALTSWPDKPLPDCLTRLLEPAFETQGVASLE